MFHGLIELLSECNIDDLEIIINSLKALTNIINDNIQNDSDQIQASFVKLDLILQSFGEQCDIILECDEISEEEALEIKDLRFVINTVVNIIPEQMFHCPKSICERKFTTKDRLRDHIKRRHPG